MVYEPILLADDAQDAAAANVELDENGEAVESEPADFMSRLNPDSLKVCQGFCERWIADHEVGSVFQFQRVGYFCKDKDSVEGHPVFNRTVPLKDSYSKQAQRA